MQYFLTGGIFLVVLFSFLANPAPVSVEIADFFLLGFTLLLGVISITSTAQYRIERTESRLLCAVTLYFSYLLCSALLGLLQQVPLLNLLRSLGPYITFFPLIAIGFLPARLTPMHTIGLIFIVIGILQIGDLFYLYFSHADNINNTAGVLRNRITLMDPRTTLPLLLAVAILPFIFITQDVGHKQNWLRAGSIAVCMLLGFIASIMTLTRAIFLSVVFGWLVFFSLYIYYQARLQRFSWSLFSRRAARWIGIFLIIFVFVSLIPKVQLMEGGLFARFSDHSASGHVDYSDGRIYDEWIPAFMTWLRSGWLSIIFGIGAGNTFSVLTGEERTYIHNLCIYSLVYGGLFGFASCLWLYYVLFTTLIRRAFQFKQLAYIAFSALLASLFFYGQLFAVHKGLAFNVMLFLMIGLAIRQPQIIRS